MIPHPYTFTPVLSRSLPNCPLLLGMTPDSARSSALSVLLDMLRAWHMPGEPHMGMQDAGEQRNSPTLTSHQHCTVHPKSLLWECLEHNS